MSWLCKIGLHKNRDIWRGEWNGSRQKVLYGCLRCGKEECITFISPLSGPRRGPMHPDAGKSSGDPTIGRAFSVRRPVGEPLSSVRIVSEGMK